MNTDVFRGDRNCTKATEGWAGSRGGQAAGGRTDHRRHFPARPAAQGQGPGTLPPSTMPAAAPLAESWAWQCGGMSAPGHEELWNFFQKWLYMDPEED